VVNECSLRCSLKNHRLHVPGQAQHRCLVQLVFRSNRHERVFSAECTQFKPLTFQCVWVVTFRIYFPKGGVTSVEARWSTNNGRSWVSSQIPPTSSPSPCYRTGMHKTYLLGWGTSSPMVIPRMGGFSFTVSQSMIFDHHCQQNMLRIASRRVTNTKISKSQ
jgi:hypothetical protein